MPASVEIPLQCPTARGLPRRRRHGGCARSLHLAALAVLFITEYGPFAITLSLLAWVFCNCLFLAGVAAAGHRRGAGAGLDRCC